MDDQQALAIVSALANGANPITGEIFAANSPYQSPDIIRALFVAQRALESRAQRATVVAAQNTRTSAAQFLDHNGDCEALGEGVRAARGRQEKPGPDKVQADKARPEKVNAGKPWSAEEDKQLLEEFDAEQPLVQIARVHGRTVNGVRARLEKHGRLPPSDATRWSDRSGTGSNSTAHKHSSSVPAE